MEPNRGVKQGATSKLCVRLHLMAHGLSGRFVGLAKILQILNRLMTGADIDCRAQLHRTVIIPHTVGIVIGETAVVEANVVLMPHVTLGANQHSALGRRHPLLKRDAYIGAGAVIVGPIMIGEGATVGANAVVTRDVPNGDTVVGIPARSVADRRGDGAS